MAMTRYMDAWCGEIEVSNRPWIMKKSPWGHGLSQVGWKNTPGCVGCVGCSSAKTLENSWKLPSLSWGFPWCSIHEFVDRKSQPSGFHRFPPTEMGAQSPKEPGLHLCQKHLPIKKSFFSKNLDPTPSTNQLRPEDDTIKNLTDAFKAKGMWENTLVVFTTDNGGPIYEPGSSNNYPLRCPEARKKPHSKSAWATFLIYPGCWLYHMISKTLAVSMAQSWHCHICQPHRLPVRGGKYSDFEGGVRTSTFISGGYIPEARRGKVYNGVVSVADWYTIFSECLVGRFEMFGTCLDQTWGVNDCKCIL